MSNIEIFFKNHRVTCLLVLTLKNVFLPFNIYIDTMYILYWSEGDLPECMSQGDRRFMLNICNVYWVSLFLFWFFLFGCKSKLNKMYINEILLEQSTLNINFSNLININMSNITITKAFWTLYYQSTTEHIFIVWSTNL